MKNILTLATALVFLISCSKVNDTQVPIVSEDDSTLLAEFVQFDTTKTAPADTTVKWIYSYDNLKRLVKVMEFSYNNGAINTTEYLQKEFFYISRDTLTYKQVKSVYSLAGTGTSMPLVTTTFYTYNNDKLVYDSSLSMLYPSGKFINTYSYFPTRIIDSSYETNTGTYARRIGRRVINFEITNGNLMYQKDTTVITGYFGGTLPPPPFTAKVIKASYFSYDNKRNPLYKLQNLGAAPFYEINEATTIFSRELNNFVESVQSVQNIVVTPDDHLKFVYDYKTNGYPKAVRIYNVSNPAKFSKGLYFYTK